jgi:O-antigen/teichoic acid export membrane protein
MKWIPGVRGEKLYVLADQVVVSGSSFATNLLLANSLGLEVYGKFAAAGMVQIFLLSLSMGFGTQVFQVIFPSLEPGDKKRYTSGFLYLLFAFSLVLLSLIGIFYFIPSNNFNVERKDVLITGLAIIFFLLQDALRKMLITAQFAQKAFLIDAITNILQIAVIALCHYMHWLSLSVAWLVIGMTFIPSVAAGIFLLKPLRFKKADIKYVWQIHKKTGGWLVSAAILQWGTGYFFVIAAGWWIGAAALGALRLAQYIFGLLNVLLQAIESYTLPRLVNTTNPEQYLFEVTKKSLLLISPLLILLSVFAEPILSIAGGNDMDQYSSVMYGLSIIYLFITAGYPLRMAIRSNLLNRHYFIGYILSMVFSITCAPYLLRHYQLYGVLAGLFITQLITLGYWMFILHSKKIMTWKLFT